MNLFVRFLEETLAWKNNFEFVWPLDRSIRTNLAYRVSLVSNSYLSRASTISNSKATLCIHWAWAFSISAKDWPSENPAEFPWTKMISLKAVAAPCRSSQEELKKELKINRIFLDIGQKANFFLRLVWPHFSQLDNLVHFTGPSPLCSKPKIYTTFRAKIQIFAIFTRCWMTPILCVKLTFSSHYAGTDRKSPKAMKQLTKTLFENHWLNTPKQQFSAFLMFRPSL